ncbi:MAG TPA: hypothetical protein VLA28_06045, partial [Afifellaceae bacterium]|nr:hypothetical protein [Afifellaceae bacterium]
MGGLSGHDDPVPDSGYAEADGGAESGRLTRRMQSARERVMERLDSPPPDVSTEDLQRAVESLARRVEATAAGQRASDRGAERAPDRNYDRVRNRGDERSVAGPSGGEDFDDILDRDDPRRGARPESYRAQRRQSAYEAQPAARRDLPPELGYETRPDARPDARQESLGVLDRLEARLDSLSERVERPKGARAATADSADSFARKDMSRQFLALEQRIDALREVAEANSVSAVREDISRLGRQVDNIAGDRGDIAGAINTVRDQLERLYATFQDRGEPDSAALVAIEQRLTGLTEQVGQFELAPAALDAVERGYAHILERMVKIERMAEDTVPPEDLWARIEAIRSQIERLPSRDSVSAMENRILELADRIDAAAAAGQDNNALARLESQREKIAYTVAETGARKDAEGEDLSRRLGDVLKRLDRMETEGKTIDFTPIEVRLSDIAARLDTRLRGPTDRAVAAIEKRLEGLARA